LAGASKGGKQTLLEKHPDDVSFPYTFPCESRRRRQCSLGLTEALAMYHNCSGLIAYTQMATKEY
jgi:hypothetical protein